MDCDAQKPKRQKQQPNNRIADQRQQSQRPAEDKEKAPQQELDHESLTFTRYGEPARKVPKSGCMSTSLNSKWGDALVPRRAPGSAAETPRERVLPRAVNAVLYFRISTFPEEASSASLRSSDSKILVACSGLSVGGGASGAPM